jgi:DNA-binding CsgD family transcriptional regulator
VSRARGFDVRSAVRTWSLRRPRSDAASSFLASDDPRPWTLLAHLMAMAAAIVILAIQGPSPLTNGELLVALIIAMGFSVLRVLSVAKKLQISTILLDAAGTAVFLAGTGAPASPFYLLALAGVWWAAQLPRRHSGVAYALAFVAAYALLIGPDALHERALVNAFEDGAVIVIVGALSDWFVRVDHRAVELSEALGASPLGKTQLAIRAGLQRALGTMEMPVDVVLAAAQLGLTVVQSELLSYLVLGLTNQEISDATNVSEATVRYRLTRLYRALGVQRRREAVRRALALGLALPTAPMPNVPSQR